MMRVIPTIPAMILMIVLFLIAAAVDLPT